ncbi:MAG: ACP S-malonyltransferase, partial [Candidatus Hydrogenedentes bacterium]|nr:ACP S-malonyltransferase [Candidatus Hydrogenedentota bacterium]
MSFFLFPGQGSQKPGMGKDFYEASNVAREIFDEAAGLLPAGFLGTLFSSEAEALNQTRIAQPALLIVEVAIARHCIAGGLFATGCAGHSLGEIPALVVAGALDFAAALKLTLERARLMSENVPEGGMAAVLGLDAEAIERALPEGVQVANYNGPAQTIISGRKDALAAAEVSLKDAGAKRVLPLPVSGPFHSRFMRPAAESFRKILDAVEFQTPQLVFVSSVTGAPVSDPELIRGLLADQLFSPV